MLVEQHQHRLRVKIDIRGNTDIDLGLVLLRPPRPCWYFLPTHLLRSQDPVPSSPMEMQNLC